ESGRYARTDACANDCARGAADVVEHAGEAVGFEGGAMADIDEGSGRRRLARREVLRGLAALAASGWLPSSLAQSAPAPPTSAQFSALTTSYTGYAFDDP